MEKEKVLFCWSGGKDSALALYRIIQESELEVVSLLTILNAGYRRVSMHGVREELLEAQAASIGIPLEKMYVKEGTNEEYEQNMQEVLIRYKAKGIKHVVFGDIFLEDLRTYRDDQLARMGLLGLYPLWKKDTEKLVKEFVLLGFKTITCCVNSKYLGEDWAGKTIDETFSETLPKHVDACGENGEFHTFCYQGPLFKKSINFTIGETVFKSLDIITNDKDASSKQTGFWYCDLIPT